MKNPFNADPNAPVAVGSAPGGWVGLSPGTKLALVGGVAAAAIGLVMWPSFSSSQAPAKPVGNEQHEPAAIHDYDSPPPVVGIVSRVTDGDVSTDTPMVNARPLPIEMSLFSAPEAARKNLTTPVGAVAGGGTAKSAAEDAVFQQTTAVPTNHATLVQHPDYLIRAGDVVPCLPIDAQNSSRSGISTCRVPNWFRSTNQRRGLLPPGARLFGQIREGLAAGEERLGISYTLIQTPWFDMPIAAQVGDELGRSGETGDVKTFFWERAGAVALYAGIDAMSGISQNLATSALSRSLGSGGGTTLDINSGTQSLASKEFDATISRPPVLTRDQALPTTVTMGQNLDFFEACRVAMRMDPNACPVQSR